MSTNEFQRLVDELDLNTRYDLRRTADRRSRLDSFLRSQHTSTFGMAPPHTPTTPPPPSPPPPQTHTQQQLYMLAQSARSVNMAKFTGFVPEGVPNRIQLMSYDVNRWLCDTETRCHVRNITNDVLMIKEAKSAVSTDFGDASLVLNTGRMNEITVYADFKSKCLKFWRCASERDRYHALSDFLSVEYDRSMGIFAGNLEKARTRILQDLNGDTAFTKGDAAAWAAGTRSSEILVSLDEVVNYFSWGVLFKAAPPSFREALRKVDVKYTDDYIDIISSVQSEMLKSDKGVKLEVAAYASGRVRRYENSSHSSSSRKQFTPNKSKGVTCYRCEKSGHISKDCHVSVKCSFCNKSGHLANKCFAAKKQNKKSSKVSSSDASNANVVDTDNDPTGEESS